jgi:SAM-dependent methyltransferase
VTLDPAHFRERYDTSSDPCGLADRWFEARKYALSVALLPRGRYSTAFEPGCSIGVLTARLAARCDSLLSWDAMQDAIASARSRTAGPPGVLVEQHVVPGEWPAQPFDLIVFSEILYYFDDADLDRLLRLGAGALRPGGDLPSVVQADGTV